MDNVDAESNYSFRSDSLQSNVSSLSGLSSYGTEFAELRHLVNSSKYSSAVCSTTSKANIHDFKNVDRTSVLKHNAESVIEFNEQYKNDFQKLEEQMEIKYNEKIAQLMRNNTRLEEELQNARKQIVRIIKNNTKNNAILVAKQNIDLEKSIYELNYEYSKLKSECANLNHEKHELNMENKSLKISMGELTADNELKNASIQSLKWKVTEQHVELQNFMEKINTLQNQLISENMKIQRSEKSIEWYKNELFQLQKKLEHSANEILDYQNKQSIMNQKTINLHLELSKSKNNVDEVRFQALKEKEVLFKRLETIDSNCNSALSLENGEGNKNYLSDRAISFYELTIEDLKGEIDRMKMNYQEREDHYDTLNQENCELMAKCMVLQKIVHQNQSSIEMFENSKKVLEKEYESLKKSDLEKIRENLELRNKISELQVELDVRNKEKQEVECGINKIRNQIFTFKECHEKLINEVKIKNNEILLLQKQKQDLFMSNNWTKCELQKIKQKDVIITKLKNDILILEKNVNEQTQKIKDLENEIHQREIIISEKDNTILKNLQEIEKYDKVVVQYKVLVSDLESRIQSLHKEVRQLEDEKNHLNDNFDIIKTELNNKDLMFNDAIKKLNHKQNIHNDDLQKISSEKNHIEENFKHIEQKYNYGMKDKDTNISEVNNEIHKLEALDANDIERITDDEKAEIMITMKDLLKNNENCSENGQNCTKSVKETFYFNTVLNHNFEDFVLRVFENLNIEELANTVNIRLKHLDEKLSKIKSRYEAGLKILNSQFGKEKIKELEILLQVKNKHMDEKQKTMDRNNRTLLRKVKEHMKGRNLAEKHLKYLQDLYDTLSEEHNTLKLSLHTKQCQIQSLEKCSERYKNENIKLHNNILVLERDLKRKNDREQSSELEEVQEKLCALNELENMNSDMLGKLKCSEENVLHLNNKIKEYEICHITLEEKLKILSKENEEIARSYKHLEREYLKQTDLVQDLSRKLTEKEDFFTTTDDMIKKLNQELEQAVKANKILSDEIKLVFSNLQQKVELLKDTSEREKKLRVKNLDNENKIMALKQSLISLRNVVENLQNDKFFLQRLSNDLKVALRSHREYNKNLENQLSLIKKETKLYSSLPLNITSNISTLEKYDETYINRLLEENRSKMRIPRNYEIQDCLGKLREEIFILQSEIMKKNKTLYRE